MGQIRGQKFFVIAGLIEVTSVQIIIFIYEFVMCFYEIVVYMNHEFYVYLLFRGHIILYSFIFLANKICGIFNVICLNK